MPPIHIYHGMGWLCTPKYLHIPIGIQLQDVISTERAVSPAGADQPPSAGPFHISIQPAGDPSGSPKDADGAGPPEVSAVVRPRRFHSDGVFRRAGRTAVLRRHCNLRVT